MTGKRLGIGDFLRNLTSKYGQLKASRELQRFARRNGMTLQELNLFLITASFLGNKIVGSRFYAEDFLEEGGSQGIEGVASRNIQSDTIIQEPHLNLMAGLFFDVVDIALGFQGLITAPGYDAIKHGDLTKNLVGFSLGSMDTNNLVSRGYFPSGTVKSLVFGNIGHSNVDVIIGAGDIVNGFFLGKLLNPFAELKTENFGCFLHELSGCY